VGRLLAGVFRHQWQQSSSRHNAKPSNKLKKSRTLRSTSSPLPTTRAKAPVIGARSSAPAGERNQNFVGFAPMNRCAAS
jgi:hypothetical protein